MLSTFRSAALALGLGLASAAAPAAAADSTIEVRDAYIRASGAMAIAAGAFMTIANHGAAEDRLIAASVDGDLAARAELHTHIQDAQGVMRMVEVKDGFAIPAGGEHALARGADHVMLMGLRRPLVEGESVAITLTFEVAGQIVVEVPVGEPAGGAMQGHGGGAMHGHRPGN
ncbi:MAG: copper chaperone PCu(A)C [Rhodobacteraceae bacterium]|jgi:copper(I)-binding protein|nr:copper chaperone PCu(A)C [Paracoccaceae bacterium]